METGWDRPVGILDQGHYVRCNYSTATKLLNTSKGLKENYRGTITNLIKASKTERELLQNLQKFKDIGPITAKVFTRDIAPIFYMK